QGVVLDFCHDLTPHAVGVFAYDTRGDFAGIDGDRLVDDAALFGVVAHFDGARQGEVFAERMADETVVGQDAAQVGVAFEDNAEQVEGFALEPVHAGPALDQRGHHGEVVVRRPGAHTQAPVVLDGQQVRDHRVAGALDARRPRVGRRTCAIAPGKVIDPAQIDAGVEAKAGV